MTPGISYQNSKVLEIQHRPNLFKNDEINIAELFAAIYHINIQSVLHNIFFWILPKERTYIKAI